MRPRVKQREPFALRVRAHPDLAPHFGCGPKASRGMGQHCSHRKFGNGAGHGLTAIMAGHCKVAPARARRAGSP
eukprot:589269-Alexandrium_andersonii.AAC.1